MVDLLHGKTRLRFQLRVERPTSLRSATQKVMQDVIKNQEKIKLKNNK